MSEDSELQKAVLAELNWEPSVNAAHIGVTVADGVVSLSGRVESLVEKAAAEAAATRVRGVKAVVDALDVGLPSEAVRPDEAIAAAAAERLAWNAHVPPGAVTVSVEEGWVTLGGEVDWHYQRLAAVLDVSRLTGVVGITDAIAIRAKPSASTISDDIMHALHRSWFFDPKTINVAVEDGVVRLSGQVASPHDRQIAIATAWSEPGVTDVVSDIVIA
jgi:osmotically-inducible protein OsmY